MSSDSKVKRFFEKIAVQRLSFYVTIVFAIGFVMLLFQRGREIYFNYLIFDVQKVLSGQIWRIITTLFLPPLGSGDLSDPMSLLLPALGIFIYYNFASSVERVMSDVEYNFYFFGSLLIGELGAVIYYLLMQKGIFPEIGLIQIGGLIVDMSGSVPFVPTYAHFSVFMALAILYPDARVLLFFVIPLRIKWVALVELGIYIYQIVIGTPFRRVSVIAALIPILIFFLRNLSKNSGGGGIIGRLRFRMMQKKRQKEWKEQWKN